MKRDWVVVKALMGALKHRPSTNAALLRSKEGNGFFNGGFFTDKEHLIFNSNYASFKLPWSDFLQKRVEKNYGLVKLHENFKEFENLLTLKVYPAKTSYALLHTVEATSAIITNLHGVVTVWPLTEALNPILVYPKVTDSLCMVDLRVLTAIPPGEDICLGFSKNYCLVKSSRCELILATTPIEEHNLPSSLKEVLGRFLEALAMIGNVPNMDYSLFFAEKSAYLEDICQGKKRIGRPRK